MEKKFTPGPWVAYHYSLSDCNPPRWWRVLNANNLLICDLGDATTSYEKEHAHLIAAAPNLYDALENLGDVAIKFGDDVDRLMAEPPSFDRGQKLAQLVCGLQREAREAKAALAKARGEM